MDRCIKRASRKEVAKSNWVYLAKSIQSKTHSRRQRFHSYKALVSLITSATFYSHLAQFQNCSLRLRSRSLFFAATRGQKADSPSTQQAAHSKETKRTNKYLRAASSCSALNICNYSVQQQQAPAVPGGWSGRRAPSCAKKEGIKKRPPVAAFSDVERKEKAPWFISARSGTRLCRVTF
jgi:hypothetical protein